MTHDNKFFHNSSSHFVFSALAMGILEYPFVKCKNSMIERLNKVRTMRNKEMMPIKCSNKPSNFCCVWDRHPSRMMRPFVSIGRPNIFLLASIPETKIWLTQYPKSSSLMSTEEGETKWVQSLFGNPYLTHKSKVTFADFIITNIGSDQPVTPTVRYKSNMRISSRLLCQSQFHSCDIKYHTISH